MKGDKDSLYFDGNVLTLYVTPMAITPRIVIVLIHEHRLSFHVRRSSLILFDGILHCSAYKS